MRERHGRSGGRANAALAALATLACLAALATAAKAELPPPPAQHCLDQVGLLTPDEEQRLSEALYGFEQRTGIQFVVAVLKDHDGELADYVAKLYEHWGIGQRSTQRGVLFVVFPDRRESRIEVAYGLEEQLPDVVCSRILRGMVDVPREPASGRLVYVMRHVAQAVAPDDPLATGGGDQEQQAGGRRTSRLFPLGFLLLVFLPLIMGAGRRRRGDLLTPLIIGSVLSELGGSRHGRRGGGGWGGWSGGGGGASGGW